MTEFQNISGKLLRVNLSNKEISTEIIKKELWEKFLGGRGLGAYYLMNEVPPNINLFSSNNKLIFMNGPLSGTLIPGNNKICVTFKSPLTETYSYSLCGGHWGPELKYAGFDGLIIEGKSKDPVFLWIDDEEIKLEPADHIWGNLTPDSEIKIRSDLGDDATIQIAVIGVAGEKKVRYACITAGKYREFGRGGAGAVMGSKKLKGIAIRGTQDVHVAEPDEIIQFSNRLIKNLRKSSGGQIRRKFGTMELVERINGAGFWVTRNFSEGYFEDGFKLEGQQMRDKIVVGDSSCFGCPVGCGKWTYIKTEDGNKLLMEGPEFETVGMLGSNCGISDWSSIMQASNICDSYGFDTINAGGIIGMVMQAFEAGFLNKKDTDDIELRFGNDQALLQILEKIGKREGLGDILAQGIERAGKELGILEFAVHSKGQTFPVYDPRGAKAMALTYATSPKGAHHMYATTFGAELALGNRFEEEGKAILERNQQFSMCIVDSIALCSTMRAGITFEDQAEAYRIVTGIDMNIERLNKIAERIINLERLYNIKIGLSRKEDSLPNKFLQEPIPKGPSKGQTVDLNSMLDEYYKLMGWNQDGIPTEAKLKELGLKHYQ